MCFFMENEAKNLAMMRPDAAYQEPVRHRGHAAVAGKSTGRDAVSAAA
jgi:hypothetical protein